MNELVSQFQRLIRIWLRIGRNQLKLFKLEFKIAKGTIKPLLFLVVLLLMSLFTMWALFLIFVGFGIFALTANILLSIAIVLLINMAFLVLIAQGIRFLVKIASFQKTRNSLRHHNIKGENV